MSSISVTTYAETAALFAVLNGDTHEARRIVADMFPAERAMFADQLTSLRNLIAAAHTSPPAGERSHAPAQA